MTTKVTLGAIHCIRTGSQISFSSASSISLSVSSMLPYINSLSYSLIASTKFSNVVYCILSNSMLQIHSTEFCKPFPYIS